MPLHARGTGGSFDNWDRFGVFWAHDHLANVVYTFHILSSTSSCCYSLQPRARAASIQLLGSYVRARHGPRAVGLRTQGLLPSGNAISVLL